VVTEKKPAEKKRGGKRRGAGRPPGVSNAKTEERRRLTAAAIEDAEKDAEGRPAEYHIAARMWREATTCDEAAVRLDALKHLDNRLQGRARESLEVSGPGGGPLEQRVFRSRLSTGEEALAPPPVTKKPDAASGS
jgi:hypothetical protein